MMRGQAPQIFFPRTATVHYVADVDGNVGYFNQQEQTLKHFYFWSGFCRVWQGRLRAEPEAEGRGLRKFLENGGQNG